MPTIPLKQFASNGGLWIDSENCIHVDSPHLLTQISGYAKYVSGTEGRAVFYRGQSRAYPTLKAALHRVEGHHTISTIDDRRRLLNSYIEAIKTKSAMLNGTPSHVYEPLLQHYGLRTNWIDIVDNIWVALWFACHAATACGKFNAFINFRRRILTDPKSTFAYIVIVGFDKLSPIKDQAGSSRSVEYEVVDLRVAAPSLYVRPHAQHGLVFRKRKIDTALKTDCSSSVLGTIRVNLSDALTWLGNGELLSVHTLFPPPYYDFGYRQLLESAPKGHPFLDTITYVGP
jgi:hypothetical protein